MVTRLSKQGGRRYSQMGGSGLVAFLASVGTTVTAVVTARLFAAISSMSTRLTSPSIDNTTVAAVSSRATALTAVSEV